MLSCNPARCQKIVKQNLRLTNGHIRWLTSAEKQITDRYLHRNREEKNKSNVKGAMNVPIWMTDSKKKKTSTYKKKKKKTSIRMKDIIYKRKRQSLTHTYMAYTRG